MMTDKKMYEASSMILKKRGDDADGDYLARVITAVQFQVSTDYGTTWTDYNNGEWVSTGQTAEDVGTVERTIEIDPPLTGNAFRVVLDTDHVSGSELSGRFEFMVFNTIAWTATETEVTRFDISSPDTSSTVSIGYYVMRFADPDDASNEHFELHGYC